MIKVFAQIELGRYAIVRGKTTLRAFDSLPGPRVGTSWICWLWLVMMLTTQAQIAAMERAVGQADGRRWTRIIEEAKRDRRRLQVIEGFMKLQLSAPSFMR